MSTPCLIRSAGKLEELYRLVHETLCDHDRLDPKQTPLLRGAIRRSGKLCGVFFQVEGPRLLKTYAVWAAPEDRILFYDSAGCRFAEIRLSESPDISDVAPEFPVAA